jgi:hypothetical protein
MSIKLIVLKSGETLISDIKELVSEEKVCNYLLTEPHAVIINKQKSYEQDGANKGEIEVSLSPWIVLSADKDILISTDYVVTLVEPIDGIKNMYEEKVNGQTS